MIMRLELRCASGLLPAPVRGTCPPNPSLFESQKCVGSGGVGCGPCWKHVFGMTPAREAAIQVLIVIPS